MMRDCAASDAEPWWVQALERSRLDDQREVAMLLENCARRTLPERFYERNPAILARHICTLRMEAQETIHKAFLAGDPRRGPGGPIWDGIQLILEVPDPFAPLPEGEEVVTLADSNGRRYPKISTRMGTLFVARLSVHHHSRAWNLESGYWLKPSESFGGGKRTICKILLPTAAAELARAGWMNHYRMEEQN